MAYTTQNQTGIYGESGVMGALTGASGLVPPGMMLMLSAQSLVATRLVCSSLGTSANSFGRIGIATGQPVKITLTGSNQSKLIIERVGAVLKVPSSPSQPCGQLA